VEAALKEFSFPIEICISDNSSNLDTERVVSGFKQKFELKYKKNPQNLGYAANFKSAVSMAGSDYVWLIGDDDLLMPSTFDLVSEMFNNYSNLDFYYVNAYHLEAKNIKTLNNAFDFINSYKFMEKHSYSKPSRVLPFKELVDHKMSSDFLGGMFLSIFRKDIWLQHEEVVKDKNLKSNIFFDSLDDTFPHTKIFANSFMACKAFYSELPMIIAVSGEREWSKYFPVIRTFRMLDLMKEYRNNGLPIAVYWRNINHIAKYFAYDSLYYFINRTENFPKLDYLSYVKTVLLTPNFYLSLPRLIVGKISRLLKIRAFYVRFFNYEH
jgi:glycosyltransferase involved in cell wall biosynthesis